MNDNVRQGGRNYDYLLLEDILKEASVLSMYTPLLQTDNHVEVYEAHFIVLFHTIVLHTGVFFVS